MSDTLQPRLCAYPEPEVRVDINHIAAFSREVHGGTLRTKYTLNLVFYFHLACFTPRYSCYSKYWWSNVQGQIQNYVQ